MVMSVDDTVKERVAEKHIRMSHIDLRTKHLLTVCILSCLHITEELEILHETSSGRLQTLIVRGTMEEVRTIVQQSNPVYFDLLPLSLEEIFIYELGGVNYEVKNIVL